MQRVDGMKVIVLTRGDLSISGRDEFEAATRAAMYRLNRQKSAEAIVPRGVGGRAEQQRFWELEEKARNTKKAEHCMWTCRLNGRSRGGTPR
jgi:hypothetical protein